MSVYMWLSFGALYIYIYIYIYTCFFLLFKGLDAEANAGMVLLTESSTKWVHDWELSQWRHDRYTSFRHECYKCHQDCKKQLSTLKNRFWVWGLGSCIEMKQKTNTRVLIWLGFQTMPFTILTQVWNRSLPVHACNICNPYLLLGLFAYSLDGISLGHFMSNVYRIFVEFHTLFPDPASQDCSGKQNQL